MTYITVTTWSALAGSQNKADEFVIRHGKGKLALPMGFTNGATKYSILWKDGCGNSSRICAQASAGKMKLYLLGGTLSPEELKSPLACEEGATFDAPSQLCMYSKEGVSTWSRRLGSVFVSLSVDSDQLDTRSMTVWMSKLRWEGP